jgi:DNA (cytosine-5)-methyltransferase 1
VIAAGFPCQDLSQAGRTAGISGRNSGLVGEVFRLVSTLGRSLDWLLLENVPFMLHLDRGRAMHFLTCCLEDLDFNWAYRVVDTRSFGLPQRRQRVVLLASPKHDPREVLLSEDTGGPLELDTDVRARGFYWTEGSTGLGWAVDAIPTLKAGSSLGIPSPPAIWMPDDSLVIPDIRDAERLQGFDPDWTEPAVEPNSRRLGPRWKLIGNAVSVPVFRWLGERLIRPQTYSSVWDRPIDRTKWPRAAWGARGKAYASDASAWPSRQPYQHLAEFLRFPTRPLSAKAAAGFYDRAKVSSLKFPPGLLHAVARHLERSGEQNAVAGAPRFEAS